MPWKRGERIPTNLIIGFLGAGKTTAIANLIQQRPNSEHWSILINEFGNVSIDHALVESNGGGVAVEKLGGGCACCTMSFAFKPLLAQFIRRSKPDRLILEPSGISHPAKVVDILRSEDFSGAIDLRNVICLIDPKDFDDPRWQQSEVFQDQVQLADIVVMNWTDSRKREQIDRCRQWVEGFNPPKQLIMETEFGKLDTELLDREFHTIRFPLFFEAHPTPKTDQPVTAVFSSETQINNFENSSADQRNDQVDNKFQATTLMEKPMPGSPLRFPNEQSNCHACGWIFHIDDTFDRDKLFDFLGAVKPMLRLKGVFRCNNNWWSINRAKDATDFSPSTYRRDSRLEIICETKLQEWSDFEYELLNCLAK
ncbi:GTP-binding protein [Mariniblastus sp.]|nr:GTP-binding protein [Mariniblastus sp.]MDA7905618.1 GTP-binding protein [Mariniblastus sp.]